MADDEATIGIFLREALAPMGYLADVVHDGETATRKLSEQAYALLITDLLMPHRTGVEILHDLRKRRVSLPVVLMSSYLSEEVLSSCKSVERLAFLQKPFGLEDLRAAVGRAVASVRC